MITGYSDRLNHALAFADKHHDQQVRKGTSAPYFTRPANVAVILTRYGRDEDEVVAGILLDVVRDWERSARPQDLQERVGDKFGDRVLELALQVSERRTDDDGVELSAAERKDDLLARLARADEGARWVAAADALHAGGTLLTDLRRTAFPETVWNRASGGREATVGWFRRLHDALAASGFGAPILAELRAVADELATLAARAETR